MTLFLNTDLKCYLCLYISFFLFFPSLPRFASPIVAISHSSRTCHTKSATSSTSWKPHQIHDNKSAPSSWLLRFEQLLREIHVWRFEIHGAPAPDPWRRRVRWSLEPWHHITIWTTIVRDKNLTHRNPWFTTQTHQIYNIVEFVGA